MGSFDSVYGDSEFEGVLSDSSIMSKLDRFRHELMPSENILISQDRLLHMIGVARTARNLSINLFGWDELKSEEMFIMGFLHDCGYEFVSEQPEHEHYGGELLKDLGFKYALEVYHHGKPTTFETKELLLLNLSDLMVNGRGENVSVKERLNDIQQRYGQNAPQYTNSKKVAIHTIQQLINLNYL